MTASRWGTALLGEVVDIDRSVVDPSRLGEAKVDHYSLPAFDRGRAPDTTVATTIKSAKLGLTRPVVLVSRLNPHIPRIWRVEPNDSHPALASTEFAPLVPKRIQIDYLYAACLTARFTNELASRVNGTSNSHQRVKPQDLLSLTIPVPPREEQERIGSVVAALERRRRLSDRMALASDEILSRLFRQYFPDVFGGGTPLGNFVDVTTGVSYRSSELGGEEQGLVTLKCFGRDGSYQERGLKAWSGTARKNQYVEEGDVVVAHTDLTQACEVLGRAVIIRRSRRFKRLAASLDMAVVRPRSGVTRPFLVGLTRQWEFRRYCQAQANGTTVLHLSRRAVPKFEISLPDATRIGEYSRRAEPLLARQVLADEERLTLECLQSSAIGRFFDEVDS